ncbi:MAG: PhoH family protein [Alphaproteobacteria bacterium]|nr:PhoH family protein [Alphaproteobacteria bacterium]
MPSSKPNSSTFIEFDNNHLLPSLFGENDIHLQNIEKELGVEIVARGNQLVISGHSARVDLAKTTLKSLYQDLKKGKTVTLPEVQAAMRMASSPDTSPPNLNGQKNESHDLNIATRKRVVNPRSPGQKKYIEALLKHDLVFGVGPAGTGKTYLAVAVGVSLLLQGKVDRIILSRPAVEAGEQLGFLPGDIREKVDPYLRPLYDALHDMMPKDQVEKRMDNGDIEVAPLAFMRGRTLSHSYVILDEAQNTTPMQMKMFLTRLGEGSYMVITGDMTQVDLKNGQKSGLSDALEILQKVDGIATIFLDEKDVVRHPLVRKIVLAYGKQDEKR